MIVEFQAFNINKLQRFNLVNFYFDIEWTLGRGSMSIVLPVFIGQSNPWPNSSYDYDFNDGGQYLTCQSYL